MKTKTKWTCQECGFQTSKSLGRCTECSSWNSFVEEIQNQIDNTNLPLRARLFTNTSNEQQNNLPASLDDLDDQDEVRFSTGFESLDKVLGGGLVPGAVILLAGDPGIGKSTLLLQLASKISKELSTLYVSAEESTKQVLLRAQRLNASKNMLVLSEQNIANIQKQLEKCQAQFAIVDSIQAVYHPEIESAPGSVSQVRESAGAILNQAKNLNIACIIVGHVTKEGNIAGPRVLEHMVDVVLQFEGDRSRQLRIVRAAKNRYGSTQELAIFSMDYLGLSEINNPSQILLSSRLDKGQNERSPSGTAVIATCEGNQALLLEVQALVSASSLVLARRIANGFDNSRLLQIIAVLEKRLGLSLAKQDVYLNIVGGLNCEDPGGDLGIAIAIATSFLDRSIDPLLICMGEIGLSGEIRQVASLERRLKEAESLGFKKAIVPSDNKSILKNYANKDRSSKNIEVIAVSSLKEALEKAIPDISTIKNITKTSTNKANT